MFIYPISLTIAAGAALLNIWLMMRVGKVRKQEQIFVGDGGNENVIRRMRAQSNFVESAPFVLILLFLLELSLGSSIWLWAAGALYLISRVLHGIGMDGWMPGRFIGALITMLTLLGFAVAALATVYLAPTSTATDITITDEIAAH